MSKEDIMSYVLNTPYNINPVIISQKIDTLISELTPPPPPPEYPEFNWSTVYSVGDKVKYQGSIYECLVAGMAQVPPAGQGFDNYQWKYIGTVN